MKYCHVDISGRTCHSEHRVQRYLFDDVARMLTFAVGVSIFANHLRVPPKLPVSVTISARDRALPDPAGWRSAYKKQSQ